LSFCTKYHDPVDPQVLKWLGAGLPPQRLCYNTSQVMPPSVMDKAGLEQVFSEHFFPLQIPISLDAL
jgi:hypothetical protein